MMNQARILVPVIVGTAFTYVLWRNFLSIALLAVVFLFAYMRKRSFREGAPYIAAGLVVGLIIEIVGVRWSHSTSVTRPDFFGLPLWAPVVFIYALLFVRRLAIALK